ncbi:hypothetical protein AC579_9135 [Pseudocercospora musae]|uniref:Uncharacterized protein n=1 Tax=Pseudocercospora musae TaxID=113226 RepID=A0A139IIG1_9PEZI|nr:hypothetical protein AC579_9135 [Pseudocercospora musae]
MTASINMPPTDRDRLPSMQPKQPLPPTDRDTLPSMQQEKARRLALDANVAALRERLFPSAQPQYPVTSSSDSKSAGQTSDTEPMA